jgi:hypothetical protein
MLETDMETGMNETYERLDELLARDGSGRTTAPRGTAGG